MGIELIIGSIVAFVIAVFGALKLGKYSGKKEAETENTIKQVNLDAKRDIESNKKAEAVKVETATNSAKVSNEINKLNPGDALSELRRDFSRD